LIGQFIIQALPLPLVAKFGQGDSAKGWAIHYGHLWRADRGSELITFATTRERVQPAPGKNPPYSLTCEMFSTCGPWS